MLLVLGLDILELDVWHHQFLFPHLVNKLPLAHMALVSAFIRHSPNLVPKDSSLLTLSMLEGTLWIQAWIEPTHGFDVCKLTTFLFAIGAEFAGGHRGWMSKRT